MRPVGRRDIPPLPRRVFIAGSGLLLGMLYFVLLVVAGLVGPGAVFFQFVAAMVLGATTALYLSHRVR
jgi:hypothetical protein